MQADIISATQQSSYRQSHADRRLSDSALVDVGRWLAGTGYRFVTVTPATHARVNARSGSREANSIEDVFGWNRPFRTSLLPEAILRMLVQADAVTRRNEMLVSRVRFSTLDHQIYIHSAFPTTEPDAVFFGPDTYRFSSLIKHTLAIDPVRPGGIIVDVGCGTGAGGIAAMLAMSAARSAPSAATAGVSKTTAARGASLILSDINPRALHHAEINAALACVPARFRCGDLFDGMDSPIDLILANPPYLIDPESRLYRHGGGYLGSDLSMRIVREGMSCLAPGGRLILYTGSPIVRGRDLLREAIAFETAGAPVTCTYTELDPDVFGEELEATAYRNVDRIAAVAMVLTLHE